MLRERQEQEDDHFKEEQQCTCSSAHLGFGQAFALFHELRKGLVVGELQEHVVGLVVFEKMVEAHHVGVPENGVNLHFALFVR